MKQQSGKKGLAALLAVALLLMLGSWVSQEAYSPQQRMMQPGQAREVKPAPAPLAERQLQLELVLSKAETSPEQASASETEAVSLAESRPADWQPAAPADSAPQQLTCTLSISCVSIFNHLDQLAPEKRAVVPEDGWIMAAESVSFSPGETVFDVLLRETQARHIHMEFENTPLYQSSYIEGINNLYEFDCGDLSGWMYCVNGWFPNYGCSRYYLADGDQVQWLYTCDLGRDIGDNSMTELEADG